MGERQRRRGCSWRLETSCRSGGRLEVVYAFGVATGTPVEILKSSVAQQLGATIIIIIKIITI
jgi:hypothetical protein